MDVGIENRLTKVETKIEHIENKVEDLNCLKDAVLRLVIIQENQEIRNKKFDKTYEPPHVCLLIRR